VQGFWTLMRHKTELTLLGPTFVIGDSAHTVARGSAETFTVVEVSDSAVLVARRSGRFEPIMGYHRAGTRPWWRARPDGEAERRRDLEWERVTHNG
jgi:hypothetical protein